MKFPKKCFAFLVLLMGTYFVARLYFRQKAREDSLKEEVRDIPTTFVEKQLHWLYSKLIGNTETLDENVVYDAYGYWILEELVVIIFIDFEVFYQFTLPWVCLLVPREATSLAAGFLLISFLLYFIVCKISRIRHFQSVGVNTLTVNVNTNHEALQNNSVGLWKFLFGVFAHHLVFCFVIVLLWLSFVWEYVAMYQKEVALRAATMHMGVPPECSPGKMTWWQGFTHGVQHFMAWKHTPCENYYKILLIDPIWEIPPVLVLTSLLGKCLIHPLEKISIGLGRCFRMFFHEIPAQWQPVLLIVLVLMCIFISVMTCNYKIHIPFVLKFEPKSPVCRERQAMQPKRKTLNLHNSRKNVIIKNSSCERKAELKSKKAAVCERKSKRK